MDYKLVQKLRAADFPFDFRESIMDDDTYNYPSLSQLIEACGDDFLSLTKHGNTLWQTNWKVGMAGETAGRTAEEALVNLWLKLHGRI